MVIDYWIIQYIEDPLCGEARNIGVVARSGPMAGFRTIGTDRTGALDLSYFSALSKSIRDDVWVFGEWTEWFQSLVRHEVREPASFEAALAELESSGRRIVAKGGGVLEATEGVIFDDALDYLFGRLVTKPRKDNASNFNERLGELFRLLELRGHPNFLQNVEVEFLPDGSRTRETVRLSAILEGKPRTVFKVVRLKTSGDNCARQVNDAIYTFGKIVEHGFAEYDRCIVLSDPISPANAGQAHRLTATGHMVNIFNSEAPKVIRSIIDTGSAT